MITVVDGFIIVGTNFRGLNKNDSFVEFKILMAKVFSFIIHTENYHCVGAGIFRSDPPWNHENWYQRNLNHPQYIA